MSPRRPGTSPTARCSKARQAQSIPILDSEMKEWVLWMTTIFMPLNDMREKIIIEKAYLIVEEQMPQCLLDFVTHVVGYKAVLTKWAEGDYSERDPQSAGRQSSTLCHAILSGPQSRTNPPAAQLVVVALPSDTRRQAAISSQGALLSSRSQKQNDLQVSNSGVSDRDMLSRADAPLRHARFGEPS